MQRPGLGGVCPTLTEHPRADEITDYPKLAVRYEGDTFTI